ncbi:cell division protein FtsW [Candidatus Curtissbacteria bacterium RBG_13_40_7]|uniref:Probable peptidoglycan glycosyltransferase FtsW n=1 Tax=Candidatus Curtissbacteria bacterium RBG_13_40_7 TaxID=1797706 RepID=A0A1F5FYD1_9BACT|nr:MAG: cell division protein FtsW [Candidatus Curtissbacteria bacterium RBG_13_40_7]
MEDKTIALKSQKANLDLWLLGTSLILVVIGLLSIYDASVVSAFRDFGDKLYYFKNQLMWAGLGTFAIAFFSFFDYHKLFKIAPFFLGICIIFLIVVLIPGIGTEINGARRWINIGSLTFQPSEICKLALIIYGTAIIAKFEKYKIRLIDAFIVYFLPLIIPLVLVLIQPDLGTALIFTGIILTVYFIGRAPIWHFVLAIPPVVAAAVIAIISEPYRLARLKSFIDPTHDPLDTSYQINQILNALAQGGLLGVGIGASRSKFAFIPEVHSDAIFAIIVEELGFIGAIFLISLFLFLIIRSISIAKSAPDSQGKILAMGISGLLAIQILFNLASIVALVPLTGVPLPFISYGGSSLFTTLASVGILLNIRRQS